MKSAELLNKLKSDVELVVEKTQSFINLDETTLNWKENSESWSILECFEHLNRYNRYYNKTIEKAIRNAQPSLESVANSTWLGKKFIAMMHPDNVKRQKTLGRYNPLKSKLDKTFIDEFLNHQKQLLVLIENARRVNLNKAKVSVEFFKLLKMNLGDALQFVIVHEQRHMLQIQRIADKLSPHKEGVLKV